MQLRYDQLTQHLENTTKGLASLYVVTGDELLLQLEAVDSIRKAGRAQGLNEREVYEVDARSDWSSVLGSTQELSLFGDRRIVEIRLSSGKPGKTGAEALQHWAKQWPNTLSDTLVILTLPRLDKRASESAWFQALAQQGVVITIPTIERHQLPEWISRRLARQGHKASPEVLEWMAIKVEGNLLAAHQEIQKLALLCPPGNLSLEQLEAGVAQVARYNVFTLRDALLAGKTLQLLRILEGLAGEGESSYFVLWMMAEEIRMLAHLLAAQQSGLPLGEAMRQWRIWGPREKLVQQALKRISLTTLNAALKKAHQLDKMIKGLRPSFILEDQWAELARLGCMITQDKLQEIYS